MMELTDMTSIMQNQLLLSNVNKTNSTDNLQNIQERLAKLPSILDKQTITGLVNGEFDISLKEYTSLNTYNTMMEALYGNNSASKFQNTMNILANSSETNLANAKSFIEKMKREG